jgi:hypothetical protein
MKQPLGKRVIRQKVMPDNHWFVWGPVIVAALISTGSLLAGYPVIAIVPWIFCVVFPGLPIFFHLIYHLAVSINLAEDHFVVRDYASDPFVNSRGKSILPYAEVSFIYYVDREYNFLSYLRKMLKKYRLKKNEVDYREPNLKDRYSVPTADLERIRRQYQDPDGHVAVGKDPFSISRVRVDKIVRAEGTKMAVASIRSLTGLVLSNHDGSKKAYLMRFRDYHQRDRQDLVEQLNAYNPNIQYLMTEEEHQALSK